MTIQATSATGTSPVTTAATATGGAMQGTKDEFLKLFMAQLQHQDPLNPQNGADMVAQLAQFSSVEQAQETNQQLSGLAAAQASTASASLAGLVGRTCDAAAGDFQISGTGAIPPLEVTATGPMKGASVVITDANGKEVRRIPIPSGASSSEIAWDGKDASGNKVPAGAYHVAVDAGTSTSTITSQWQGRIDAVELTPDGTRLRMGGLLFAPSNVTTIGVMTPTTAPGVLP